MKGTTDLDALFDLLYAHSADPSPTRWIMDHSGLVMTLIGLVTIVVGLAAIRLIENPFKALYYTALPLLAGVALMAGSGIRAMSDKHEGKALFRVAYDGRHILVEQEDDHFKIQAAHDKLTVIDMPLLVTEVPEEAQSIIDENNARFKK